ncbi:hypothetical protein PAMA_012188 [Pampus argenteus]
MCELEGRSAGAGSVVHSAERRLSAHRMETVTTVWRSVVKWPPSPTPSVFYSSITKEMGKQAVTEQHSTYRPVRELPPGAIMDSLRQPFPARLSSKPAWVTSPPPLLEKTAPAVSFLSHRAHLQAVQAPRR